MTNKAFVWGNLIAVIVVVVLLLVGAWFGLSRYTRHGEQFVVPTLTGMTQSEAFEALRSRDLIPVVSDSVYSKDVREGRIVSQKPAAGQEVKKERVVYLTINSHSMPTAAVPDVADNSSLRQAVAKLKAAGFALAPNEYINGDEDWVYEVKFKGRNLMYGERIPVGSALTLVVGNGSSDIPTEEFDEYLQYDEGTPQSNTPQQQSADNEEQWF